MPISASMVNPFMWRCVVGTIMKSIISATLSEIPIVKYLSISVSQPKRKSTPSACGSGRSSLICLRSCGWYHPDAPGTSLSQKWSVMQIEEKPLSTAYFRIRSAFCSGSREHEERYEWMW